MVRIQFKVKEHKYSQIKMRQKKPKLTVLSLRYCLSINKPIYRHRSVDRKLITTCGKTKYCNELGRQNIKTSNINMNTENVYCKSTVRNLVEFTSYIQGCSKDCFYKYLATVDAEVRNFKKIRFSRLKLRLSNG